MERNRPEFKVKDEKVQSTPGPYDVSMKYPVTATTIQEYEMLHGYLRGLRWQLQVH